MKHTLNRKSPCFVLLDDDLFALTMTEKIIRRFCRRPEIRTFSTPQEAIEYMEAGDQEGVFLQLRYVRIPAATAGLMRRENGGLPAWPAGKWPSLPILPFES
jgi:hypothetical protein